MRSKKSPQLTIIDVMDDPHVFGPWFTGATWVSWKVFLRALFGMVLSPAELETYRRHTGRHGPPTAQAAEAWLVVGRRGGKSLISALIAIFLACFRDYTGLLAPGERGTVMVIAADRQQARVVFRYIVGLLESVSMLSQLIESKTKEAITLTNRVNIEVHTASFRAVRGYTVVAAICDEIAFWPNEDSANPDAEILHALKPAMATIPLALLLAISSPYSRRGEIWRAYREHFAQEGDPVLVWQADSKSMNPAVPAEVIEASYREDEASASAEYGAQFRRDIEAFVSRDTLEACIIPGRRELPPVSGTTYVAFVDPSGGSQDAMTLAIGHHEQGLAVLDAIREVLPPFSPEATVKDFAEFLNAYGITRVHGDRYAGEWPREQFRKHGISYDLSEKSKSDLYREVLPAINSRLVSLLDHPRLLSQFCGLERRTARGGKDSIDHGPNGHDDVANVVSGVLLMALGKRTSVEMFFVETPGFLSPVSCSDRLQIEQRTGYSLQTVTPVLTCTNCAAFEDNSERCQTRNLQTQSKMPACEHFTARLTEPK